MGTVPYSYVFKFIIIGDPHIGKSSILQAYTRHTFNPEQTSTIGVEFGSNVIDLELEQYGKLHKDSVKIQIWDTAGQERYQSVTAAYYRGAAGVFIVYDITSKSSFKHVKAWYNRFLDKNQDHNTTQFTIIGNKSDKADLREVPYSEGKELADRLGTNFYETSCKKMDNIDEAIKETAKNIYSIVLDNNRSIPGVRKSDHRYYRGENQSSKKKCCR